MSEVIAIASGKGGVGKSVLAASLAIGLAKINKKVILMDLDLGMRGLDLMLGMGNVVMNNILDLVKGRCTPEEVMIPHEQYKTLWFVAAAQAADKESLAMEEMKAVMEVLKERCDYIIVDCPPGVEKGFYSAIGGATRGILVTIPEYIAIRDADRAKELFTRQGVTDLMLVINRVQPSLVAEGVQLSVEQITEILGLEVIGELPEDNQVTRAVNTGVSLMEGSSPVSRGLWQIAQKLCPEIGDEHIPSVIAEVNNRTRGRFRRKV